MEPLTWTGSLSFLNLFFALAIGIFAIIVVVQIFTSIFATAQTEHIHSDGTIATSAGIVHGHYYLSRVRTGHPRNFVTNSQ